VSEGWGGFDHCPSEQAARPHLSSHEGRECGIWSTTVTPVRGTVNEIAWSSGVRHGQCNKPHPLEVNPSFRCRKKNTMSAVHPQNSSPFSEIRDEHRQATLAIIATSAVVASSTLVAALLVTLGIAA
jgi:hypothetical protein